MAPRSSTATKFIIEEPASLEDTRKLFGIGIKRAAKLERWGHEALVAVGGLPSKTAKRKARRPIKKRSARRSANKPIAKQ